MPQFVPDSDLITIVLHYYNRKNPAGRRIVKILDEAEAAKMLQDPAQSSKVETLNTKWRAPTWKVQQMCFTESGKYHPETGRNETNWSIFSDIQMKNCLLEWDFLDAEGRNLPVTPQLIDALPDVIANELLLRYRKAISIDEETVGN